MPRAIAALSGAERAYRRARDARLNRRLEVDGVPVSDRGARTRWRARAHRCDARPRHRAAEHSRRARFVRRTQRTARRARAAERSATSCSSACHSLVAMRSSRSRSGSCSSAVDAGAKASFARSGCAADDSGHRAAGVHDSAARHRRRAGARRARSLFALSDRAQHVHGRARCGPGRVSRGPRARDDPTPRFCATCDFRSRRRSIMAGMRTAAVINVGTATLAAFIGAGGLGEPIVAGLALSDTRYDSVRRDSGCAARDCCRRRAVTRRASRSPRSSTLTVTNVRANAHGALEIVARLQNLLLQDPSAGSADARGTRRSRRALPPIAVRR